MLTSTVMVLDPSKEIRYDLFLMEKQSPVRASHYHPYQHLYHHGYYHHQDHYYLYNYHHNNIAVTIIITMITMITITISIITTISTTLHHLCHHDQHHHDHHCYLYNHHHHHHHSTINLGHTGMQLSFWINPTWGTEEHIRQHGRGAVNIQSVGGSKGQ